MAPKSPSKDKKKKRGKRTKSQSNEDSVVAEEQSVQKQESNAAVQSKKELDVVVHRVRCLGYKPAPILAMAACSSQSAVAISRNNGHVELKSANQKWRTLSTIHGQATRPMHTLAWTCGSSSSKDSTSNALPTLVGGSIDGTLSILDWQRGCVCGVMSSGGGGVQSITSLCTAGSTERHFSSSSCCNLIAGGCEDGSVRIIAVDPHAKKLQLTCTVPTAGAPVLSVAWRRQPSTVNATVKTVLYAGVADGTIRRYDSIVTKDSSDWKWTSTLRMTVECLGRSTPTRVWSLLALQDDTVVSGDSLGHVQFWNGTTGALISSFNQNDVHADVLCLAKTRDESRIFASGVDSRVICIEQQQQPAASDSSNNWIMTHAQRPHTHDVKAMAILPVDQKEKLCSGGIDTKLCVYETSRKEFARLRPKIMYPWPSVTPISVSNHGRLLGLLRHDCVDFFGLSPTKVQTLPSGGVQPPPLVPDMDQTLGKVISTLKIKSASNLTCCALNQDASVLALSDVVDGLLVFRLEYDPEKRTVTSTKLPLSPSMRFPCLSLNFVANKEDSTRCRLLCATIHGQIIILDMAENEGTDEPYVESHHTLDAADKDSNTLFPIHSLQSSDDGKWLVSCQNSFSGHGKIQVFANQGVSFKPWWTLPKLEVPYTSVGFLCPSGDSQQQHLAVSCITYGFYVFDVQNQSLSEWSEKTGFPITPSLPPELGNRNDYPVRFGFNRATPNRVLMGSFGAFCAIDLEKPMPKHCRIFPETHVRGVKRRRPNKKLPETPEDVVNKEPNEQDTTTQDVSNCTICLRYNSMLYLDYLQENELLVVEQPWLSVVSCFPDALERKIYGS